MVTRVHQPIDRLVDPANEKYPTAHFGGGVRKEGHLIGGREGHPVTLHSLNHSPESFNQAPNRPPEELSSGQLNPQLAVVGGELVDIPYKDVVHLRPDEAVRVVVDKSVDGNWKSAAEREDEGEGGVGVGHPAPGGHGDVGREVPNMFLTALIITTFTTVDKINTDQQPY